MILKFFPRVMASSKHHTGDWKYFSQFSDELFFRKMRFTVRDNHLSASSLVVKCNANIGEAYWQTSDATIQIIGKPSYMLESRSNSNSGIILLISSKRKVIWSFSVIGKSTTIILLMSLIFLFSTWYNVRHFSVKLIQFSSSRFNYKWKKYFIYFQ